MRTPASRPTSDQRRLRAVQRPETGENPSVLVAVAVADHHLLHELIAAAFAALFLHAPRGHGMLQEGAQNVRAAREVVDRLEQRDDRQPAGQTVRRAGREADLTSEQVRGEQIGQAPRHADDQRAQTSRPATPQVLDQDPVRAQHRVGFGARRRIRAQERPGRRELAVQEVEPAMFVPVLVVGFVESGRRQQLSHRQIVEAAVLANVQRGQMKAERLHGSDDRPHRLVGQTPRPNRDERLVQQLKIAQQLVGAPDIVRVVQQSSAFRIDALQGKACEHQGDQLPPGLFRLALDHLPSALAELGGQMADAIAQRRRRLLHAIGEARLPGQPHQLMLEQEQAVEAQVLQRLTRDLRGDEGGDRHGRRQPTCSS